MIDEDTDEDAEAYAKERDIERIEAYLHPSEGL